MSNSCRPEDRVTIVTVTHNSMAVLPKLLASVPEGAACVIIDNLSDNQAALAELATAHGAHLICNDDNLGFGAACNIGAAQAQTEFLFFLNPDARLQDGTLAALVACAEAHPAAAAFNPAILNANGKIQFKRGSVLLPKSQKSPPGWPAGDSEVPVLTGAAFFVRLDAFEATGGFDPAIFMYHEDDDLALRLREQYGPLIFARDALVTHDRGNSTVRSPKTAAFRAFHMGRSRVYATRKHNVARAGRKALLSALVQLASPVTLFSKRKRAKQLAFLNGVLGALRQDFIK
jgi:GT2 family glycosyltransferase